MKHLVFHRSNILQSGIRTKAGLIDIAQVSEEHPGISVRMDAVICGGPEALQYRPTLMGMG